VNKQGALSVDKVEAVAEYSISGSVNRAFVFANNAYVGSSMYEFSSEGRAVYEVEP
jgi:hypothetical protein